MSDSLILGERIELLGGGAVSDIPECAGVVFHLGPGWTIGAPDPDVDILATTLGDGEVPIGYRASNRAIQLPITIIMPPGSGQTLAQARQLITAAREILLQIINQPTFSLRLTREGCLPTLYDCHRASQAAPTFSLPVERTAQVLDLVISFTASPYGRSDLPTIVNFPSPLLGQITPPSPVTIDGYNLAFPFFNNWLNGNQSGFTNGQLNGWAAVSGVTSVLPSTAQAYAGAFSMAVTASGVGNAIVRLQPYTLGLPVSAGESISFAGQIRAATTTRGILMSVQFYDALGNNVGSTSAFSVTDSNSAWTAITWQTTSTVPAGAVYAIPQFQITSPAANEVHYIDFIQLGYGWINSTVGPTGSSIYWDPNTAGIPDGKGLPAQEAQNTINVNLEQGYAIRANQSNGFQGFGQFASSLVIGIVKPGDQIQLAQNFLLTAASGSTANSGFEASIGTWVTGGNSTIAQTAAQAHSGTNSLGVTSVAAGNMEAQHTLPANILTTGLPVVPGQQVFAQAWFRTAVSARTCQVAVGYYDANGGSLGPQLGPTITDSTSAWTRATDGGTFIAPANAAFALVYVQINSTGGAAELHYVDDVAIAVAAPTIYTVTSVSPPFFNVSNVNWTPNNPTVINATDLMVQVGPAPNLTAVAFYAGFGSTNYYHHWSRLGGLVNFRLTLFDNLGHSVSFSKTQKCSGSNNSYAPVWHKIRIPITSTPGFNFSSVTGYSLTIRNRGVNELRYTQLYLDSLTGVPAPTGLVAPSRGFVYDLSGIIGSARAPCSLQLQQGSSPTSVTQTFSAAGAFAWTAPPGVTSVAVRAWGRGGAGSAVPSTTSGGGGGSGGTAFNAAVAVTPGTVYNGFIPAGAQPGDLTTPATTFTGDSVTVSANAGASAPANSFTGGAAGAAGTGGFAGAAGGTGSGTSTGAGGASSAGTAGAGNPGQSAAAGGAAGATVAGGGAGGHGRPTGSSAPPSIPGGGGGGGLASGNRNNGIPGQNGQVTITYTLPPAAGSIIAHRPPYSAPAMLSPFVSPNIDDVPNGTTEYPLVTTIYGIPARFGGTYTVVACPYSWDTPGTAKTITVTVKQYEQSGGAVYTSSVSASITPNQLTQIATAPAGTGFAILGELTLPVQELPQDNVNAYFTVTINDSDTSDRYMDILFLDTLGSTVIIQSPTPYANYYLDEAPVDRDLGLIMGTLFDRPDAVSVLDRAIVSGGPITVDPFGSQQLFLYSLEGAPGAQLVYYPRWMEDRYQ